MADRYWVGGAGTWNSTNTTNWSATSGGAGGASVPTSSDRVFFDANSGALGALCSVSGAFSPHIYSLSQVSGFVRIEGNGFNSMQVGDTSGGTNCGDFSCLGSFGRFTQITFRGTTSGSPSVFQLPSPGIYGISSLRFLTGSFSVASNPILISSQVTVENSATLNCTGRTIERLGSMTVESGGTLILNSTTLEVDNFTLRSGSTAATSSMISLRVPSEGGQNASFSDQRSVTSTYPSVTFAGENNGPVQVTTSSLITITALNILGFGIVVGAGQTLRIGTSITSSFLSTIAPSVFQSNSSGSSQFTLSCASGTLQLNGFVISNCNATGGATFTADATSVNAYNNTGIRFANSQGFLAFFG